MPRTQQVDAVVGGCVFEGGREGYVAIEAEHYYKATAPEGTQWTVYPYYGRTRSAVALTPYTQSTGDAALNYRFQLPASTPVPAKVKVHVIVSSIPPLHAVW